MLGTNKEKESVTRTEMNYLRLALVRTTENTTHRHSETD
jgi:hypothetical protein